MPIKSKPVNPLRVAEAAKGRLSSAGAAYAERQARAREQQRQWAAEEQALDEAEARRRTSKPSLSTQRGQHGSASSSSSLSSSLSSSPAGSRSHSLTTAAAKVVVPAKHQRTSHQAPDDDEAALLEAAQERTRRFLAAGDDVRCGEKAGPSPAVTRLVAYEAAKRLESSIHASEASTILCSGGGEHTVAKSFVTDEPVDRRGVTAPVTVRDVLDGLHDAETAARAAPSSSSEGVAPAVKLGSPSAHADPAREDFDRLMQILAEDVQQERKAALVSSVGAMAKDTPGTSKDSVASAHNGRHTLVKARTGAGYRPAPRSFAQLQADALQELYEEWSEKASGDDALSSGPFVAADHQAAAFALAAATATAASTRAGVSSGSSLADAPLTLEELVATETALRNAARPSLMDSGHHGGDTSVAARPRAAPDAAQAPDEFKALSAQGIADAARGKLSRFMQAVAWTERVVRDPTFVSAVANYLYEHHRAFLSHFSDGSASPEVPTASAGAPSASSSAGWCADGARCEHSHEEYRVYETFGQHVSEVLLRVLGSRVADFDEEEFVEALFDSPEEDYTESGGGGNASLPGPRNVLSYPAWRIVLSMSSFEGFFTWMMDYIQEEYRLGHDSSREEAVVAVGGTRGLRALIKSTYHRTTSPLVPAPLQPPGEDQYEITGSGNGVREAQDGVAEAANLSASPPTVLAEHPLRGEGRMSGLATSAPPSPLPTDSPLLASTSLQVAPVADTVAEMSSWSCVYPAGGAGAAASSPVGSVEGALSHVRQSQRLFPTPPSSAASESSLRPRNSHLASLPSKGKKTSATCVRDLPPLASTPPAPQPLGDQAGLSTDAVAVATAAARQVLRPSSQPEGERRHASTVPAAASSRLLKPKGLTAGPRKHSGGGGDDGSGTTAGGVGREGVRTSSSSSRTHSTTRSSSKRAPSSGAAFPKRNAGVKPKLKRTV